MTNQHYLFWVITGAIILLITFFSLAVGKIQTPKKGLLTFAGLFIVLVVLALYVVS